MFEFLFKYPAEYFANGNFISILSWWQWALLPLAIAVPGFVALGYFKLHAHTQPPGRLVIALLRGLALTLILFSLSRPLLEVTAPVPQAGMFAVLLDNSISMRLAHSGGGSRADFIRQQFATGSGGLLRDLQRKFDLRLFAFGARTSPITGVEALDFAAGDSDLSEALGFVEESLQGRPLAGLLVISDGAMPASEALEARLLSLRSKRIPLYSIGVGERRYPRDIEISRVSLPGRVLNGSRVMADVSIRQQGYDDLPVELLVEDDSRILHKQQLRLKPGVQTLKIPLAATEAGAHRIEFHIAPMAGEQITANNRRQAMLAVSDRKMRILYFEGEPRFELKFVRRAVADDENLGVSGLVRTADAKFYRVGIDDPQQLRNGFPITRDELFSYDAIILGSVEMSLLSLEQQQMIVDFVSQRGGGLLLLGGRHAFTEGGYRDSVLHALSPVVMPRDAEPEFSRSIKIQPTDAAWVHPALLLADSSDKSIERWLTLPPLTIVNPIRELKPGATLLLQSSANEQGDRYVAMAWHRYGRGKVIAFPVQNSWIWQMHIDIDLDDQSHELLWRQLLRWLVESVPPRLSLALSSQALHAGGTLELRSEVRKADFTPPREARVQAIVTAPNGNEQVMPLAPQSSTAGVYTANLRLAQAGDYLLRVEAEDGERVMRSAETRLRVSPEGDEYFHSELNETRLRQLARETGGRYFAAQDSGRLADAVDENLPAARALLRYELWDMPALFLLLVLLLCAEWGYRRRRGLA
jgi:uncharacterized membrane protein